MSRIIGRTNEQKELSNFEKSSVSEFVAIYGRRRVGKTFLVREYFADRFDFYLTGLANSNTRMQLINFQLALKQAGNTDVLVPENWLYAFNELKSLLEKSASPKKIVFLDELPWMDTPKSDFISALENFWNSWASARNDIALIVCGSSTSWMMSKLINNKGGLHNRITKRLKIQPFTLSECKNYLQDAGILWDDYQLTEAYMVFGGIPYYWSLLKKGLSLAQNIDALFFSENGTLRDEFKNLYAALFKNSEKYIQLVETIGRKSKGLTRNEIIKLSDEKSGGGLSKMLDDLESCGFIRSYQFHDKKHRDKIFQLTDFYSLFYFNFIKSNNPRPDNYWSSMIDSPVHRTWTGYAFERVCMEHIPQIKQKLGISGVHTRYASWRSQDLENGSQVDLLIDRNDSVINLCEIKYSINPFLIDKKYAENLRNKIGRFKQETGTHKSVFLTFISTFGLKQNEYAGIVQNEVLMKDLFC
ncbi:MAG: ATP-binding protein [Bacteroidales bacterium]